LREQARKLGKITAARAFGIDQGVEAKIDGHRAAPSAPPARSASLLTSWRGQREPARAAG
jgi:hypothetical protein